MRILFLSLTLNILFFSSFSQTSKEKLPPPVNSGELLQEAYQLFYQEENVEDAIEKLAQIPHGDTNYSTALLERVLYHFELEENEKALELSNKGLTLPIHENTASYFINKGFALTKLERYDEAEANYKAALEKYPLQPTLYNNLAANEKSRGNNQKAYEMYCENAERFPFHPKTHFNIGLMAFNSGHLTETFLAFNMVVLLNPESDIAFSSLSFLNELSNNTKIEREEMEDFNLNSTGFEDIDLLIENYVALGKKYKVKSKSNLNVTKQNHLILNNLQKASRAKGFYAEFYLPFYIKLMEEDRFEGMSLLQLSTSQNSSHEKIVSKKQADIKAFNSWFRDEWLAQNEPINLPIDYQPEGLPIFFRTDGTVEGIGNYDKSRGITTGDWLFFFTNGMLQAKGKFNESGKKEGYWEHYTSDGKPNEFINFKDGNLHGEAKVFYENGELKKILNFDNGEIVGPYTENYLCGATYVKGQYGDDGYYNGDFTYFFEDGTKEIEIAFLEGKPDGDFIEYFINEQVYVKKSFSDGKENGPFERYYINGQLAEKSTKLDGNYEGEYTSYYANGQLYEQGQIKEGNRIGEWVAYYRNGNLKEKAIYDERGKLNGMIEYYDYDGVLHHKFDFKKGDVYAYTYYDKEGNVISEDERKGKDFFVENRTPQGVLSSKGAFIYQKGKDGDWIEYNDYGAKTAEFHYEEGEREDEATLFYPWGEKKQSLNYKDDLLDGYFESYHPDGSIRERGYFVNDNRTGIWQEFYVDGTLEEEAYYLNGNLNGPRKSYSVNGKIRYEEMYDNGVVVGVQYFDTTGAVLNEAQLKNGNGAFIKKHYNGEIAFKGLYTGGKAFGDFIWNYPSGEVQTAGKYIDNKRTGNWTWLYENGQVEQTIAYSNGEKNGEEIDYFKNGDVSEKTTYVFGERNGTNVEFHKNGEKERECPYYYDKIHGDYKFYSSKGTLQLARVYSYGHLDGFYYLGTNGEPMEMIPLKNGSGKVVAKYPNGNTAREFTMKDGYFEGEYAVYYENGKLYYRYQNKYDERHGKYQEYFASGKIKQEIPYTVGYRHGIATTYYENGKIEKTETFRLGKKHGETIYYDKNGNKTKTELFYDDDLLATY